MSNIFTQALKKLCWCFYSNKKTISSYGDQENIERQQFMRSENIDNQFSIRHNPTQFKGKESTQTSRKYVQKQQQHQNERQQRQHTLSTKQQPIDNSLIQSQQQNHSDYTDMISENHPYFLILYNKIQLLPNLFDIDQKYRLDIPAGSFPLKMYCKQSEVRKTNIFIYKFQFDGISYEAYEAMLNNFELQKTFDSNIDGYYKKIESPNNDTKVIYLSYHKVLIVAPRDFIYVRYTFKKNHENWSVCTSLPSQEQTPGKIRGQIVLTATKVVQNENSISITVYSQVNMKMGIKPQMAKNRGKTQIKKYLQKCYKYLAQNKSESII